MFSSPTLLSGPDYFCLSLEVADPAGARAFARQRGLCIEPVEATCTRFYDRG